MQISAAGLSKLQMREGFKERAYRDTRGIWTIGVGHTSMAGPPKVKPGMTLTPEEVTSLFAIDIRPYENTVSNALKVPVSQNAFDAMVSLCYNIGEGGFRGSSVVHFVNAGNIQEAANAFLMWDHPPDLLSRRNAERAQFLS